MIRVGVLIVVAVLALASTVALDHNESAQAGALPSNIPGDADCSGQANAKDAVYDLLFYVDHLVTGLACQTNGNVICGDNINLDDAMQIIRYAAGLIPELPPGCPAIGVQALHGNVDEGTDTIHGTFSFDLDSGMEVSSGGDLFWSIDSSIPLIASLVAPSGKIGRLDSFLPFSGITYSQLVGAEFRSEPFDSSEIPANTVLAVKTTEGNYAKVKIVTLAYNLQIDWVTYSP